MQSLPAGLPITPANIHEFTRQLREFLCGKKFNVVGTLSKWEGLQEALVLVREQGGTLSIVIESGQATLKYPAFSDEPPVHSGTIVRIAEMTVIFISIGEDGKAFDWNYLHLC